jgi:hypothetical protein
MFIWGFHKWYYPKMDDLGVPLGNRKHFAGCEYEVSDVSDMASHSKGVDPDWVWYFHELT